jgi:signal transduction histidine kinase
VRRWYLFVIGLAAATAAFCAWKFTDVQLRWVAAGGSYMVAGLYAWYRRPESKTGMLLVLTGCGVWSSLAEATRVPVFWTVGSALEASWLPPLVYLMLSFPTGRLTSATQRFVVLACLTLVAVGGIFGSLFYNPADFGCQNCQPRLNLILIHSYPDYVRFWGGFVLLSVIALELVVVLALYGRRASAAVRSRLISGAVATIVVALCSSLLAPHNTLEVLRQTPVLVILPVTVTVMVIARWWRASPPAQRVLGPMLLPASAFLLAVAAQQAIGLLLNYWTVFKPTPYLFQLLTTIAVVASISLPVTFLLGLARARHRHTVVSDLVVELGDLPPAEDLERALSKTLRDPSLSVGRWDPADLRYVHADGTTLALPAEGSGRTATLLERDGRPLAAIVHDEALLENDGLLDSVAAATRLVVENERLHAEVRAQLADVRASRARIVVAADAERRRLERDLHDGAQQRIVSVCLDLKLAAASLGSDAEPALRDRINEAAEGLQEALAELRELARGIHPAVLTEEGLGPALQSLTERARIPTKLVYRVPGRLRPTVEATAYFVASEALANVAKHAQASRATIEVSHEAGQLLLEVADDGVGGADPSRGSGLRGLLDRVGAVDGGLQVVTLPGQGTRVLAEIPCA